MAIEVFRVGQDVKIARNSRDGIRATVLQIAIRGNETVQYQVVWWDGRSRRVEWLESFEVGKWATGYAGGTRSTTVGFAPVSNEE